MPIKEGWEVSRDRIKEFEKMVGQDDVGDPIITSKCRLGGDYGFLIASNNGFAWRIHGTGGMKWSAIRMAASAGKSKWVRWYDVADITPKKPGLVLMHVKLRKKGALVMKKGKPKIIRWKIVMDRNKDEPKQLFLQRREAFYDVLMEIFNRNRVETDPEMSDSRI